MGLHAERYRVLVILPAGKFGGSRKSGIPRDDLRERLAENTHKERDEEVEDRPQLVDIYGTMSKKGNERDWDSVAYSGSATVDFANIRLSTEWRSQSWFVRMGSH